jgi:hypothetical protein
MVLTLGMKAKVVEGTFDILFSARRLCQESRVDECLKYVDLRYELMSVKDQLDLNVEIQSKYFLSFSPWVDQKKRDLDKKRYLYIPAPLEDADFSKMRKG